MLPFEDVLIICVSMQLCRGKEKEEWLQRLKIYYQVGERKTVNDQDWKTWYKNNPFTWQSHVEKLQKRTEPKHTHKYGRGLCRNISDRCEREKKEPCMHWKSEATTFKNFLKTCMHEQLHAVNICRYALNSALMHILKHPLSLHHSYHHTTARGQYFQ